jgi:hypothetical protein
MEASPADRAPAAFIVAATSILFGLLWDISWHKTIGRDTFWTPAHLAIHFGGILAGLTGTYLILRATFADDAELRGASVRVWGFRGPLGAWMAIWGAFAMVTSAPFDDWWHNAYGLDVKILSPPHVVLALGMFGVVYGAVLLVVARQNRGVAGGSGATDGEPWLRRAYVYVAGIAVCMLSVIISEYTDPNQQHGALFYLIIATLFPSMLAALGRAARVRWPMTSIAAVYMAFHIVTNLILQLFHARPMLAPIYNPVDHMVPSQFPLLLIVPAFAADLVLRRMRGNDWLAAAAMAVAFTVTLVLTQWLFSEFLLSPYADNAFFTGRHWPYFVRPGHWQQEYWDLDTDRFTATLAGLTLLLAFLSSRLGLARGRWMREVVR